MENLEQEGKNQEDYKAHGQTGHTTPQAMGSKTLRTGEKTHGTNVAGFDRSLWKAKAFELFRMHRAFL